MNFNKRISLVKKEVFQSLSSEELDPIKGTNKTGYYSLAAIETHLMPALDKYDLDLDLELFSDKVVAKWYDCEGDSEKERSIEIDFKRIENVGKLQLMANIVQSEGAVKSYIRRYSLTTTLRIPSTDLIDNKHSQNRLESEKKIEDEKRKIKDEKLKIENERIKLEAERIKLEGEKKITQKEIKKLMALANQVGKTDKEIKEFIKLKFNLDSKKELNFMQFDYLINRLQSKKVKEFNKPQENKEIKKEIKVDIKKKNKTEKNKTDKILEDTKRKIDEMLFDVESK